MTLRAKLLGLGSAVALMALTACQDDTGLVVGTKSEQPLKAETVELLSKKNMRKEDPILIRIFKEDSQLEVWKQDTSGKYALFKSYKICAWGGKFGPKFTQGDYQSPEGFYTVKPSQMNPNSSYYLSFDIGYPNSFDKAYGRTGGDIMVHGDCSSSGCFAMTDPQVAEIYALAREAFAGGQRTFQVQAYPFRMTAANMAKYRSSPHFAFWKNLKEGYDHFELTRLEPKVDVCNKRYIFDARLNDPATTFQPAANCPVYTVDENIQTAMAAKQAEEDKEFQTASIAFDKETKEKAEADAKRAAMETEAKLAAQKAAEPPAQTVAQAQAKSSFSFFGSSQPAKPAPAPAPASAAVAKADDGAWWKKLNPF